jgi:hypothetical protein
MVASAISGFVYEMRVQGDRTDAGHDLALRQMAVAHQPSAGYQTEIPYSDLNITLAENSAFQL